MDEVDLQVVFPGQSIVVRLDRARAQEAIDNWLDTKRYTRPIGAAELFPGGLGFGFSLMDALGLAILTPAKPKPEVKEQPALPPPPTQDEIPF